MLVTLFLVLVTTVSVTSGLTVDCSTFNPNVCTPDLHEYCFTDGTVVISDCQAKAKICNVSDTSVIDDTWAACTVATTTESNGGNSSESLVQFLPLLIFAAVLKLVLDSTVTY